MSKATSVGRSLYIRVTVEPQNPFEGQIWNDAGVLKQFKSGSWKPFLLTGDVVSSEGGSGFKTYVANGDFETDVSGVSTYDDGGAYVDGSGGAPSAIAISRTTGASEILEGVGSLKISKAASDASGEGVTITTEALDPIDQGKTLYWRMSIDSDDANYTANDIQFKAYDVTNSQELIVQGVGTTGNGLKKLTKGKVELEVITLATTETIRLSMHIESDSTTGSVWSIVADEIKLEVEQPVHAPVITAWQEYTLEIGAVTSAPTKGTIVRDKAVWRQVGGNMEILWTYEQSASGSGGTGEYTFSIPSGYTIDTTITPAISPATVNEGSVGSGWAGNSANGLSAARAVNVIVHDSTNLGLTDVAQTTGTRVSSSFFQTVNVVQYSFRATIPIVEFAGGTLALAKNSFFRASDFLKNGTRVTGSAPTELGEYRSYLRNAGAVNYTETNGDPTDDPTSEDGIRIYNGNAFSAADTNNEPTRYEIFVGRNKDIVWEFYQTTGRTDYVDTVPHNTNGAGGVDHGYLNGYDPTTGIAWIVGFRRNGGSTTHRSGVDEETQAVDDVYFDILVYEKARVRGVEPGKPIAISAYHNTNDQTGLLAGESQANITLTETNEGGFTIVSNNIVIPAGASGLYIVQGQVTTDGFGDQTVMQGKIKVNGSIVSNNYQVNARANDFNSKAITGKPLVLSAGDTVGLFMESSGSGGRIVHGSALTYLTLTKIGGTILGPYFESFDGIC